MIPGLASYMNNLHCPFGRYWFCHILVALAIAAGVWPFMGLVAGLEAGLIAGLTAGATFYIGREYTQWEASGKFDWKGLVAPVAVNLVILLIYKVL